MSAMQELYDKVANDSKLQAEFAGIIEQYSGKPEELKEKLLGFAKNAGYPVDYEEARSFFARAAERSRSELSEQELDSVAGGKRDLTDAENEHIYKSLATAGSYCAGYSLTHCW